MKHELFALEQAAVFHRDSRVFYDFNLHIYKEEILGIICDSVAQEEALIGLFGGSCRIDGTVRFSRKTASRGSLSALFQDYFFLIGSQVNLISSLSIPENICMFADHRYFVYKADYFRQTEEYRKEFGIDLDLSRRVDDLEEWEKLIVVLLKAFAEQRRIIVFANVSEHISEAEYEPVYALMRKMIPRGFTFLIIDSIETNIFSSADKVMVIRGGTSIACFDAAFFNRQAFYDYMLQGQANPIADVSLFESDINDDDLSPVISLQNVSTHALTDISFQASRGEILKILCLDRATIQAFHALAEDPFSITGGTLCIGSQVIRPRAESASMTHAETAFRPLQVESNRSPSHIRNERNLTRSSISWCPESPYEHAIISTMSIRDNLLIPLSRKVPDIFRHPGYSQNIDQFIKNNLGIDHPQQKAWNFSPEILQKVVYTRFLIGAPSVLFVEKPFTDTNVRIRETTLEMLKALQRRGITIILLISSPSNLTLLDGDDLYAKNGRIISEEEMYRSFYG